ncbi:hypothetical protein T484DRAFT_1865030 [Baffinella frigidus]|nr:hypothetical protein T484DRAFT_1865030 [Cryptophyta sp. CCMP2293]
MPEVTRQLITGWVEQQGHRWQTGLFSETGPINLEQAGVRETMALPYKVEMDSLMAFHAAHDGYMKTGGDTVHIGDPPLNPDLEPLCELRISTTAFTQLLKTKLLGPNRAHPEDAVVEEGGLARSEALMPGCTLTEPDARMLTADGNICPKGGDGYVVVMIPQRLHNKLTMLSANVVGIPLTGACANTVIGYLKSAEETQRDYNVENLDPNEPPAPVQVMTVEEVNEKVAEFEASENKDPEWGLNEEELKLYDCLKPSGPTREKHSTKMVDVYRSFHNITRKLHADRAVPLKKSHKVIHCLLEMVHDPDFTSWLDDVVCAYRHTLECMYVCEQDPVMCDDLLMSSLNVALWLSDRPWAREAGVIWRKPRALDAVGGPSDHPVFFDPREFMKNLTLLRADTAHPNQTMVLPAGLVAKVKTWSVEHFSACVDTSLLSVLLTLLKDHVLPFETSLMDKDALLFRVQASGLGPALKIVYKAQCVNYASAPDNEILQEVDHLSLVKTRQPVGGDSASITTITPYHRMRMLIDIISPASTMKLLAKLSGNILNFKTHGESYAPKLGLFARHQRQVLMAMTPEEKTMGVFATPLARGLAHTHSTGNDQRRPGNPAPKPSGRGNDGRGANYPPPQRGDDGRGANPPPPQRGRAAQSIERGQGGKGNTRGNSRNSSRGVSRERGDRIGRGSSVGRGGGRSRSTDTGKRQQPSSVYSATMWTARVEKPAKPALPVPMAPVPVLPPTSENPVAVPAQGSQKDGTFDHLFF